MSDWLNRDALSRAHFRMRNTISRVWLRRGDDSKQSTQTWQTEGYLGEVREGLHRVQPHGFSSLPPVGSAAVVVYQGGHRGHGMILGGEHPKYRPTGLKPGEHMLYMVDGAKADGTGGTTRGVLKAALGWATSLFGKNIVVGDSNTINITITGSGTIKIAGNLEVTGTLKVDGATTVQDLQISGTESGGGSV